MENCDDNNLSRYVQNQKILDLPPDPDPHHFATFHQVLWKSILLFHNLLGGWDQKNYHDMDPQGFSNCYDQDNGFFTM